jgi:hypothetical protein
VTKPALAAALAFVAWTHGAPRHARYFESILLTVAGLYAALAWAALLSATPSRRGVPRTLNTRLFGSPWPWSPSCHRALPTRPPVTAPRASPRRRPGRRIGPPEIPERPAGRRPRSDDPSLSAGRRAARASSGRGSWRRAAGGLWFLDGQGFFKTGDVFAWTRPGPLAGRPGRPGRASLSRLGAGPLRLGLRRAPRTDPGRRRLFRPRAQFRAQRFLQLGAEYGLGVAPPGEPLPGRALFVGPGGAPARPPRGSPRRSPFVASIFPFTRRATRSWPAPSWR